MYHEGTEVVALVVYDGCNRYWYEGPSCEGWVDRRHEATWYGDHYDAKQAAGRCGGRVVGVSKY
jgi:hypothetical protein